jgi:hypothetical protein
MVPDSLHIKDTLLPPSGPAVQPVGLHL